MKKVLVSVMMVAALAVGSAVAQKTEKAACCPAKKENCEKSKTCTDKKDCPKKGDAKCCQGASKEVKATKK